MMSVEVVMFMIGSVGIAASVYGHFLYRHDGDQLARSPEPRVTGADAVSGHGCHSVRKPR